MYKALLILMLFGLASSLAQAQHYQRTVSEITNCTTLSCIESIRGKHKDMKKVSPLVRSLGLGAARVLLDFDIPPNGKAKELKHFKLSLLVAQDSIRYGQLEQWENGKLETTYLFINNHQFLRDHVAYYNKVRNANNSYRDLLRTITSREPIFWIWID